MTDSAVATQVEEPAVACWEEVDRRPQRAAAVAAAADTSGCGFPSHSHCLRTSTWATRLSQALKSDRRVPALSVSVAAAAAAATRPGCTADTPKDRDMATDMDTDMRRAIRACCPHILHARTPRCPRPLTTTPAAAAAAAAGTSLP